MKQHSSRFLQLVNSVKNEIKEITPQQLHDIASKESIYLIDVREKEELRSGYIPNAIHLSKGVIERDIEKVIADPQAKIVTYCSGGYRCALVAHSLQQMGYDNVMSLQGGSSAWQQAGLPWVKLSNEMLNA